MSFLGNIFNKIFSKGENKAYSNDAAKKSENESTDFEKLSEEEKLQAVAEMIKIGAESGDAEEQYNLGMMLATGKGPYGNGSYRKDINQAKIWFEKSARQGHVKAQSILGALYEKSGNFTSAVKCYELAAKQNYAPAIVSLAMLYGSGNGIEKDLKKSHELFLRAAEQGEAFAQYMVGLNLFNGTGVEENVEEAFQWYIKAAKQGEKHAQFEMGMMYEMGGDKERAKQWYEKSAAQGNCKAKERLQEL